MDEIEGMMAESNRNARFMAVYFALAVASQAAWFALALARAHVLVMLLGFVLLTYCNGRCAYHGLRARALLKAHMHRIARGWHRGLPEGRP